MKIPTKFRQREALIYQSFAEGPFDFSETALQEFFAAESTGSNCHPSNGFLIGKKRMQIAMDGWERGITSGTLTPDELLTDPEFVKWPGFIDKFVRPRIEAIVKKCVASKQAFGVGAFFK